MTYPNESAKKLVLSEIPDVTERMTGFQRGHGRTRLFAVPVLALLFDCIGVWAAFELAFYVRFLSPLTKWFPVTLGVPRRETIYIATVFGAVALLLLLARRGFYRFLPGRGFRDDLPMLLKQIVVAWVLLIAANFFYRDDTWSRLMYLILLLSWIITGAISRWLLFRVKRGLHLRGRGMLRTALVGYGESAEVLAERLTHLHSNGIDYVGWIGSTSDPAMPSNQRLGDFSELDKLLERNQIERVVVAVPDSELDRLDQVVERLTGQNIEVAYVPVKLQQLTSRVETRDIGGVTVLELKAVPLSGWNAVMKRTFDFSLSGIFLFLLSPVFFLVSILVKLSSPGPVFYGQERVTMNGRTFKCWKFRSMRSDAEKGSGAVWAVKNDPRVTPIGKFLRRSSIDELPQLWNIFTGDMSFVGPRPERPVFVNQFSQEVPRYHERHRVRTGLTGWAQVTGLRGQAPITVRTTADLFYVENWSFGLDLKIILMTFYAVIWGEDAY